MEIIRNKQNNMLGIVMDATLSFSEVFPQIYYMLDRILGNLQRAKKQNPNLELCYGVTLFHERAESLCFSDGSYYTADESEVLGRIAETEFFGGSRDAKEDITEGIREQLMKFGNSFCPEEKEICCFGLLVLSDSPVDEADCYPDLTEEEPGAFGKTRNRGLRFAYIYSCTGDYLPQLRITDHKGALTENDDNMCFSDSLTRLLPENEAEAIAYSDWLSDEILKRFYC